MILLLTLFIVTYLLVSYLSIYQLNMRPTQAARLIFGMALIIFASTWLSGLPGSLWVILLVICLVINIEITAFKAKIHDMKGQQILHIFTVAMAAMIIATAFLLSI
ncbi:membrane stabilizing protein MspA [Macrococcus carouselicus]|uniref:DUF1516 family protein n=1 Tax=Macrococcus carouselicus TaxID=69969 RepID=A0A9Q8CKV2_9STAP|nr:membrane stabilizing protein MspA [Macrococcus carouselicus]TDM02338.1 hypothetical protein ERX40_07225 [Macrococcus carouselicus]